MLRRLLLMLLCAWPARAEMSADDVMALTRNVRNGVMFMMMADENGRTIASGTGFIVSKDGKLITNRHVAEAGPRLVAKAVNGRIYHVQKILAEDADQDLAVLQLEENNLPSLPLGASENISQGTSLVMVG